MDEFIETMKKLDDAIADAKEQGLDKDEVIERVDEVFDNE